MKKFSLAGVVAIISFVAVTARAHDLWLETKLSGAKGKMATAKILLLVGEDFAHPEAVAVKPRDQYGHFDLFRGDALGELMGQPLPLFEHRAPVIAEIEFKLPAASGTHLVALESTTRTLSLPADKFQAYLREEQLNDMLEYRTAMGQEQESSLEFYSRHMKTIFQVGPIIIGNGHPFVTRPIDQELEIVPDINPYMLPETGGAFGVQVFFYGGPLADRAITITHRTGKTTTSSTVVTDLNGHATFRIAQKRGQWMVHLVQMQHPDAETPGSYRSWWASLTFKFSD